MSFSIFNLRSFPGKVQTQFNLYKLLHAGALTDPTTRPYCQMSYTAVVYTPIHNVSAQRDSYAYQSKGQLRLPQCQECCLQTLLWLCVSCRRQLADVVCS